MERIFNIVAAVFLFSWAVLVVVAFCRIFYKKFHKTTDWITTTATMTGKRSTRTYSSKIGGQYNFTEYEIFYRANGEIQYGYFDFHPGIDPDPPYPEKTMLHIRYREKYPKEFEVLDIVEI